MKTEWINDFIKQERFYAPYVIDKDSEYEAEFLSLVNDFVGAINQYAGLETNKYGEIKNFATTLQHVIHLRYEGEIIDAQEFIDECVGELMHGSISVCAANTIPAFWGYNPSLDKRNGEVQFFRARTVEEYGTYTAKDMFHIPFSKRAIASSERFSIPGLPCFYLGNTTYACWAEIGRPFDEKMAVSPVILQDNVKVFNLAVSFGDLLEFQKDYFSDENDRETKFVEYIKLMLLMMASSFVIKEEGRQFKSEYVIPQLLMLSLKKHGLDGVSYYSTRTIGGRFAYAAVNLALFPTILPSDEADYSKELAKKVYLGDARNFGMYKHMQLSLEMWSYRLRVEEMPEHLYVNDGGIGIEYSFTDFRDFDCYLFRTWDKDKRKTAFNIMNGENTR